MARSTGESPTSSARAALDAGCLGQRLYSPAGSGLRAEGAVAADRLAEIAAQAKPVEYQCRWRPPACWSARRAAGASRKLIERVDHPGIRTRVVEQVRVVVRQKPLERARRFRIQAGAPSARDAPARRHPRRPWRRWPDQGAGDAQIGEQRVDGIGEIDARIDQRAIEIENTSPASIMRCDRDCWQCMNAGSIRWLKSAISSRKSAFH